MSLKARAIENDSPATAVAKIQTAGVDVHYGDKQALFEVDLDIDANTVTALIGPSGCGKSTFLRCLNRMNDIIDGCRIDGAITLDGMDLYARDVDVVALRAKVGMGFLKPNPFPKSIYENVAFGPRIHGVAYNRQELDHIVEKSLRRAGLFDEVNDRLDDTATGLSGGQQQRVAIARALANQPSIILADEPTGNLDPALSRDIMTLFEQFNQIGTTVIVASHDRELIDLMGFRIVELARGCVVRDDQVTSLNQRKDSGG